MCIRAARPAARWVGGWRAASHSLRAVCSNLMDLNSMLRYGVPDSEHLMVAMEMPTDELPSDSYTWPSGCAKLTT